MASASLFPGSQYVLMTSILDGSALVFCGMVNALFSLLCKVFCHPANVQKWQDNGRQALSGSALNQLGHLSGTPPVSLHPTLR